MGDARLYSEGGADASLTPQGLGLSDFLGPQLISPEIAELMEKDGRSKW